MKLIFDQNISRKLVNQLKDIFPDSTHVSLLHLEAALDTEIWDYSRDNGFTIVTQDSDFNERSLLFGHPPKIIWIRTGNTSTKNIEGILKKKQKEIETFSADPTFSCLQIC